MKEKSVYVLGKIYGWGILAVLLLGGLTGIAFFAALFLGEQTGGALCVFLHKQVFPVLIYAGSAIVLLGLIRMSILGEKTLTMESKKSARRPKT